VNFPAWAAELVKLKLRTLVVYESNQAWTLSMTNGDPKSMFGMVDFQVYGDSIHLFINLAAEHELPWQEKLLKRLLKLAKDNPRHAAKIVPLLRDQGKFEKITAKIRALILAFELSYSK
jgi:hypothetical protein